MLLNLRPEHVPLLEAAINLALRAASGYSVRTCPERDIISAQWEDFAVLAARVKALEERRELGMGMSNRKVAEERHYIHFSIDKAVYDRLYAYLLKRGGGKIRQGVLGHFAECALTKHLNDMEVLQSNVRTGT